MFDRANNEGIGSGDTGSTYAVPLTKLLVFEHVTAPTSGSSPQFFSSGGASNRSEIYTLTPSASPYTYRIYQGGTAGALPSPNVASGQRIVLWVVFNGASSKIRYNGITTAVSLTTPHAAKGITLGNLYSGGANGAAVAIVWASQKQGDLLVDQPAYVTAFERWANKKWKLR